MSCVDMLPAMYLAVAVSSSSAIGFPLRHPSSTADYRALAEALSSRYALSGFCGRLELCLGSRALEHRTRYLACRRTLGFDAGMAPRFLTILTGSTAENPAVEG